MMVYRWKSNNKDRSISECYNCLLLQEPQGVRWVNGIVRAIAESGPTLQNTVWNGTPKKDIKQMENSRYRAS